MKIEDLKTVNEFFGVKEGASIWIEGYRFDVGHERIYGYKTSNEEDGRVLVGCLTGQLKWTTEEPMTAEEKKVLTEVAAWFPSAEKVFLELDDICLYDGYMFQVVFGINKGEASSKAYEVLAPILEKYGEIDLDEYREQVNEKD